MVNLDSPITTQQRLILDNYYANGFNSIKAYCDAKGIEEPTDVDRRVSIQNMVSQTRKNNPQYIAQIEAKNEKTHGKMRDRLVSKLEDVANTYEELVNIAMSDGKLSKEDDAKFRRLKAIMTTKDYNKAVELIGRLTGSFEPEKVEVKSNFQVSWGEQPKIQETTKPVIDVDHTDLDE